MFTYIQLGLRSGFLLVPPHQGRIKGKKHSRETLSKDEEESLWWQEWETADFRLAGLNPNHGHSVLPCDHAHLTVDSSLRLSFLLWKVEIRYLLIGVLLKIEEFKYRQVLELWHPTDIGWGPIAIVVGQGRVFANSRWRKCGWLPVKKEGSKHMLTAVESHLITSCSYLFKEND